MASITDKLAGLRPPANIISLNSQLKVSQNQITQFNESLSNRINDYGLTGQALSVAEAINNVVVPTLRDQSQQVQYLTEKSLASFSQLVKAFQNASTQALENAKATPVVELFMSVLKDEISEDLHLINDLSSAFMTYHSDINQLIASYKEEDQDIEANQTAIKARQKSINDEIYDKLHSFPRVVLSALEEMVGVLQRDLNELESQNSQLQQQRYQNAATQGGLNNMIGISQQFQSLVEQQQHEYNTLFTNVTSLSGDLNDLMSDPNDWEIGWQAVKDDWDNVAKSL